MNELQGIDSNDIIVFMVAGILVILLSFSFILYFIISYRNKQKAYALLQLQKSEIDNQKIALEKALHKLKTTQNQLIQSEKLASLGELTAGIAHEIQNPLNFVNNFSEVSVELVSEIQDQRQKTPDNRDEELEEEILNDIKQNLEKISYHGKRADSIVKGMLQHSRATSGQKEATDINALADEYLRLAYHGLRAKDKNFNATMKTEFASDLATISVVQQDIGRVLLNLFTNAFYSVTEKKRNLKHDSYEAIVSVTTKNVPNGVAVIIEDNGVGIPQKNIDKIMQPFFTTKPTGEGTGLGLSLSYDIIKAHHGTITVESVEKQFACFTIMLPYNTKA